MLSVNVKADFDTSSLGVHGVFGVEGITDNRNYLGTKFGVVDGRIFEYVSILNIAPDVEKVFSLLHLQEVIVQNMGMSCSNRLMGPNECAASVATIGEIEVFRQFGIPQLRLDVDGHV